MAVHAFPGGLRLDGHKAESAAGGLRRLPRPARLRIALLQHAGTAARALVVPGQRVVRGQILGEADGELGLPVHAPCAGEVLAIEAHDLPQWPGLSAPHVVLATSGDDAADAMPPLDPWSAEPGTLRCRIRDAGLAGLGGAGFPTAEKLSVARDLLVLNGAECEPWTACDDALLRVHADEVVLGGRLLRRLTGAAGALLALEDSMIEAIAACREALAAHGAGEVGLAIVPTLYPEGGERQLIQALTRREVPRGGLPRDLGVIVQNVATARAAWRAVVHGEPLVERVITITGPGVARPGNVVVPLGATVAELVADAGGYTPTAARLLLGGPMMGVALAHDDVALGKTHNCVLVLDGRSLRASGGEMPCIRCGDCADACPSRLLPQLLLRQVRAGQLDTASDQGLPDCIECGCCDLVCPSHIPLTAHFRHGRAALRRRLDAAARADAARQRFESRQQRLAREAADQTRRREARQAAAAAEAVAAAIERAKARRGGGDAP